MRKAPGNTPLLKSDELSQKFKCTIFIKDESKNPTGTHKDRRSELIIRKAKDEHINTLALIASGNAGYSLGKLSKGTSLKIVNIIDKRLNKSIKDALKKFGKIVEVDLSKKILKPEEIISLARHNEEEVILDATNGFHKAYEGIVEEIKGVNPDFIIVPIGSGETFVGIYSGIKRLKLKTKLIGVGVRGKWQSFADKLHTPWTPYRSKIQMILKEGHKIIKLSENEIKQAYKQRRFNAEPSSAVVFGALSKIKFKVKDKVILINSGKGCFDG